MANRTDRRQSLPARGIPSQQQSLRARKFGDFMEGRVPQNSHVKRWDGAARTSTDWDHLRRDPELWFRSGNCYVHLYGKGQSRRGPAFKVPFGALLAAKCHPLVQRFLARGVPESPGSIIDQYDDLDYWNHANPTKKVDLYIPAPPMADTRQAFLYHLATRNLFAWVFRRSVVGDHLGTALIGLLNSMSEFRCHDEDNVLDLMDYLDEEGYLDMRSQPNHALALLHLAEFFQLKEMYIDAFSHCVGMSERLFLSSEYQHISSVSKKLIRRARVDMDLRLGQAGAMLRTFLEDELSETHLGLPAGARAHLERFRSFILSFYTTKLGYYPPASVDSRSTIFEPEIYRVMCDDFEALYELLVDDGFTSAESSPFLAQGGLCTVQSVHSFDLRYRFQSLQHPLPLLPEISTAAVSRRVSWLSRGDKLKPDRRLVAHAALIKASNGWKQDVMQNDLVRAYRKFEEESIVHNLKADRHEKITLVDARKVRWILVYSIYQVLRNCTQCPAEVRDTHDVEYNLAVSTANLPPWKEARGLHQLIRRQTDFAIRTPSSATSERLSSNQDMSPAMSPGIEIKPDIDYFALTHREQPGGQSINRLSPPVIPPRSRSLSRSFSRNGTFRRSLSIFSKTQPESPSVQQKRPSYHEIVVHGYGNGTNVVNLNQKDVVQGLAPPTATRTLSTASNASSDSGSALSGGSSASAESTGPPTTPGCGQPLLEPWSNSDPNIISPVPVRGRRQEILSLMAPSRTSSRGSDMRPTSAFSTTVGPRENNYAQSYEALVQQQEETMARAQLEPPPLRISKDSAAATALSLPDNPDAWHRVHADDDDDVKPEWEQFKDLGGLTSWAPVSLRV